MNTPFATSPRQTCDDSYQKKSVALNDAHWAGLQPHDMLKVQAKSQKTNANSAQQD